MNNHYVYFLINNEGEVHYVGRGTGERARISRYRHPLADGTPAPLAVKVRENLTKEQAKVWERLFIRAHQTTIINERTEEFGAGYGRTVSKVKKHHWEVNGVRYFTMNEVADALGRTAHSVRASYSRGTEPDIRRL